MVSKSNVHGPATFMQATGFVLPGFPSMGSWISYGLGSMNDDLPTFVVLPDPRGFAPNGHMNWSSRLSAGGASGNDGAAQRSSSRSRIYFRPTAATSARKAKRKAWQSFAN